jgi:uncharacterized cupin superfamily protein
MSKLSNLPTALFLTLFFLIWVVPNLHAQKCKPAFVEEIKSTGAKSEYYGGDLATVISPIDLKVKIQEIPGVKDTFVCMLHINKVEEAINVLANKHLVASKRSKFRLRLKNDEVLTFSAIDYNNGHRLINEGDDKGKYYVTAIIIGLATREEIESLSQSLVKIVSWEANQNRYGEVAKKRAKKFQGNINCFLESIE